MRKLLTVAVAFLPIAAFAQTTQPLTVKFVPPPELGAKPNRPGPSVDNAYTLTATVQGTNAQSKQPWSTSFPVRSYAIVSPRDAASGLPTGQRMHKPMRLSFRKTSLQDGILATAIARQDDITMVKLEFKPLRADLSTQYITVHELAHASLEVVDEYAEAAFPTYHKLRWTWFENQKPQTDEWIVPPEKK